MPSAKKTAGGDASRRAPRGAAPKKKSAPRREAAGKKAAAVSAKTETAHSAARVSAAPAVSSAPAAPKRAAARRAAAKIAGGAMITIEQFGSGIGCIVRQKRTLRALGLRRPRQRVVRPDNPAVRGMVKSIPHLVRIVESA